MKTLIFNGSPRKNGDTKSIITQLTSQLDGEHKIIDAYDCGISPCIDCRYCHENNGCSIDDKWQIVDKYIEDCDNIIIASPIYFSEISGQLLVIASRVQSYWSSRFFRKKELILKKKRGGIILVGGGDGHMSTPIETSTCLLHHMNAHKVFTPICFHDTNNRQPLKDEMIVSQIQKLADFFNSNL